MVNEIALSSSKSLVNRYLILKEGHPCLSLEWSSEASDVVSLERALRNYKKEAVLDIGEGGTSFRFLVVYLSSQVGEWTLKCKPSLLRRPQEELFQAVRSLGAQIAQVDDKTVELKSNGWNANEVSIDVEKTTQVLTALTLTAVSIKKPLKIKTLNKGLNSDYFLMTYNFLKQLGFKLDKNESCVEVFENLALSQEKIKKEANIKTIEADWSSSAFLFVLAALKGELNISNLEKESLQPDSIITEILKKSGVDVPSFKSVRMADTPYSSLNLNLQKSPDLFPVLAVFSCFCSGQSRLSGAPQLKYKESDRIQKMHELLNLCGYKTEKIEGGLSVQGESDRVLEHEPFSFDVSSDHRLFMACEILIAKGYQITLKGENSILKSFPEYIDLKKGVLKCFF